MILNSNITIYNKYIENRAEKFQRWEIIGVVWQASKAVTTLRNHLAANSATLLIPMRNHDYRAPKAWLIARDGWTLQEGDIIARGITLDEITTIFSVSDLKAKYDDVFAIASVDAMDQGSPYMKHWQVGLK